MAKVKFKRFLSDSDLEREPIEEGSFIVTKDGTSYVDFNNERVAFGGTSDTEMSDESINSVQNKVIKSYVDDAKVDIQNAQTDISNLQGKIVWTNSSPTSSFGAQTITLSESLSGYDFYEILFMQSTADTRMMTTGKIPVGYGTILLWFATTNFYRPTDTTVSGNTITFLDCKNGSNVIDNTRTIPMYVIAYNTGLFS